MTNVIEPYKSAKLVGGNTVEIEYMNGDRAIRYHNTDILTWYGQYEIILNSDGWRTPTTKGRMNKYLGQYGYSIYQHHWTWFLRKYKSSNKWGKDEVFKDGMSIILLDPFRTQCYKAINKKWEKKESK